MTQREELNEDQKKLNWLLGLEKETLADMAHQQSKIIEKLQKAAKAQAVTCPNVNETINNSMPRGYMLNTLIKFQKWRIGEDVRTLDETGLTPRSITLAIDWAIEQLDKYKTQAVPQWIPVSERLPEYLKPVWIKSKGKVSQFQWVYDSGDDDCWFEPWTPHFADGSTLDIDSVEMWAYCELPPSAPEQQK